MPIGWVLLVGSVIACDKGKKEDAKSETKAVATAAATAAAAATASASASASATAKATAEAADSAAPASSANAGRSAVPVGDEWDNVGEVTVKGSSALHCETKMLREWLRVSCRGKNDTGGTPTWVEVVRGNRPGNVYTFASGDVTSLVVAFVEGVRVEALFSWSDKSHKLVVRWDKGAPKPTAFGEFEGASSPLADKGDTNTSPAKHVCVCTKKLHPEDTSDCDKDLSDFAGDPDCERSYGSDCQKLLECSRGEPGTFPKCLAGFRNDGAIGRCYKECEGADDCPSGVTCSDGWGDHKVCMPD